MAKSISGVISRVSNKENKPHPKYGKSFNVGVQLDGEDEWYNLSFNKKSAEQLGLEKGRVVSFTFSVDDYGNKIDPKSIEISEEAAEPSRNKPKASGGSSGGAGGNDMQRRIEKGQAVNIAVELFIAGKEDSLNNALRTAVELQVTADKYYDKLRAEYVEAATKPKAKAKAAPAQDEEEEEEAPPPKAKAAPAKAKPKAKPEPEQEEEEEAPAPKAKPKAKAVPAAAQDEFDDSDIPF